MRLTFFLVFSLCFSWLAMAKQAPSLKIRMGKNLAHVHLSGTDLITKSFLGKKINSRNRKVDLDCTKTKYFKSSNKQPLWAEITSPSGVINWQGKYLAGKVQLVASDTRKGKCHLVSEMLMESYLSQVLSREMHPSWPIEALKAQAVVARTYAYFKVKANENLRKRGRGKGYDLENSEMNQVMGTLIDKSSKTTRASIQTTGEIIVTKTGKVQEAFFHSKCGGRTLTPRQVWGGTHMKGYKQVNCPFCHKHGKKNWDRTYSKNYLSNLLSNSGYLEHKTLKSKSYVTMVVDANKKSFKKTFLRKVLGRSRMPSNNFSVSETPKKLTIHGRGHGHGVGMCQYGAYEMAKRGLNYKQILNHYFPLMKMKKIY